jgi:formylglycine-generating enzyme
MWHKLNRMMLAVAMVLAAGSVQADVFNMGGTRDPMTGTWTGLASVEFVTVGNPGNAADTTPGFYSYGMGSVGYVYQMGKYDVTVGQYCQFLNSVAKTDTYGLYSYSMAPGPFSNGQMPTIGITRNSSSGSYSYSVAGSYSQATNCPIFNVSWGDAARFCNWLQNGQPSGEEGAATTETGAYTLNGATSIGALMAITRNVGATYFIPSADEWYKAAYYKGAGYWKYPTQSNTAPVNILSSSGTNNANLHDYDQTGNSGSTDPVNYLTPVGTFSASHSPYGVYDMGGDVWQWTEIIHGVSYRGARGGCFGNSLSEPQSSIVDIFYPTDENYGIGFRVAMVPEPGSITLLLASVACLLAYARRRRNRGT